MHEYSLVQALVERVDALARERGATAIHRLVVSAGELSGVDPRLFQTAFETFRAGTCCAGAELELRTVAARWACPSCGRAIGPGSVLTCPACSQPARLDPDAEELRLLSIDMEVP